MSDADGAPAGPRPRQVTMGGLLALVSCVLLILGMIDSMARVRSVEMRDSVERALTTPPGNGLGIEIDTVMGLLRGTVLLTAGLAAAGAVLAGYTLARHRGARVGLSVTAVLLLFSASFVSGLLPVVVAIGATMLWGREARDWFAGRPARPAADRTSPARRASPDASSTGSTLWHPPAGPVDQHPRQQPVQPAEPVWPQHPQHQGGPPQHWRPPGPRSGRPVGVSVAAWLTWVFSGLTTMFFLLLLVTLLADPSALVEALQDNPQVAGNGYSGRDLLGILWVATAVGLFWSLAAVALAVLAYRRVRIARLGLVVSAVLAGVLGVATIVGLLNAVAAFATVVLLFTGGANRWYAGEHEPRREWPGPPPEQTSRPEPPEGRPPVW